MKKYITLCMVIFLSVGAFASGGNESSDQADPVRIFGVVRGDEAETFREVLAKFTAKTGIEAVYEESAEFETEILIQAESGNLPDIAGVPQPGLMNNLVDRGIVVPMWPSIIERIESNYSPAWKELASYKGETYGIFHRVNVKSFIWYPKKQFEAGGYQVPTTWDELIALAEQVKADGITPFSFGFESGAATGWPGTDWLENIILRSEGPEYYDKWYTHQIPFNDPGVVKAFNYFEQIMFEDGFVLGGPTAVPTTFFGDAILPVVADNPSAMFYMQGNFIISFMPDDIKNNVDEHVGVFPLPVIDTSVTSPPLMGGGELYIAFDDRPEVRAVMEFLTTWESGEEWARLGGALFPFKEQDYSAYATEIERSLVQGLVEASAFRFDASDLMPPEVGNGTFWTGMVEWVTGTPAQEVADDIEASWP